MAGGNVEGMFSLHVICGIFTSCDRLCVPGQPGGFRCPALNGPAPPRLLRLHPPAAQATPGVRVPGNGQTLPGKVRSDGSREAPRRRSGSGSGSSTGPIGQQAEEHVFARQRELRRSLEEVPARQGDGRSRARVRGGGQAEQRRVRYLTGLRRGHTHT